MVLSFAYLFFPELLFSPTLHKVKYTPRNKNLELSSSLNDNVSNSNETEDENKSYFGDSIIEPGSHYFKDLKKLIKQPVRFFFLRFISHLV